MANTRTAVGSADEASRNPLNATPAAAIVPGADGVLTRQELAKHLKISLRTVEEWQHRGVLPYIKVGKIVLFYWPDVIEHLRKNFRVCRRHFNS